VAALHDGPLPGPLNGLDPQRQAWQWRS